MSAVVFADTTAETKLSLSIDPFIQQNFAVSWWNDARTFMRRFLLSPNLNQVNSIQTFASGAYNESSEGGLIALTAEYDWSIKRWKLKSMPNFYVYVGTGILLSGGYYDQNGQNGSRSVGTGFAVPVGLEWFAIRNFPDLSFVVEVRPNVTVSYLWGNNPQTGSTLSGNYEFNSSIVPQLFVSYYF
jgi:hypothetical protein